MAAPLSFPVYRIERIAARDDAGAREKCFRRRAAASGFILSPLDSAFLRRVYLRQLNAFVEEENLHLVEEKLVCVGVRQI